MARLIGAPPGYVGYEEGGIAEALAQASSAVCSDEVEKAPGCVQRVAQVPDDGA